MSLRPVFCAHKTAEPPKHLHRDAEGRVRLLKGVLGVRTVVTASWCQKDHYPDK